MQYGWFYKALILNIAGVALLGAAYRNGWVTTIFAADPTHISHGIAAIFAFALAWAIAQTFIVSRNLANLDEYRQRFFAKVSHIADFAVRVDILKMIASRAMIPLKMIQTTLVVLGLAGTVVGIIIALDFSGVDLKTGNQAVFLYLLEILTKGVNVAMRATLVGIVGYIWVYINFTLLYMAISDLVTRTLTRDEKPRVLAPPAPVADAVTRSYVEGQSPLADELVAIKNRVSSFGIKE